MDGMRRVRILPILLLLAVAGLARPAHATEVGNGRNIGLGFQLGDPTALIGKAYVGGENAFDFGLGFWGYGRHRGCYDAKNGNYYWCAGGYDAWSIHADYLWQYPIVQNQVKLDWHIGPGARIFFVEDNGPNNNDVWLAARMPVGLDLTFNRPGFLEVFFELAPALYIVPGPNLDIEGALGVRFYF